MAGTSSAHPRGYLGGFDIENIEKNIIKFFTEKSKQIVINDINALKKEVDLIIQKINLTKDNTISRNTKWKENLMAEGYLIVFKLRHFLLEEEIDYRYYYTTDEGKAKVFNFNEKDILNYMHFDANRIGVGAANIKKTLEDQSYQNLLDKHYDNLIAGIQPAKKLKNEKTDDDKTSYKVVHSYIMRKYESSNPGLRKKDDNRYYQLFNMGHIYEAMDVAFSEAILNKREDDFDYIENLMYGKYLNYDNIAGTKGGDNALTMTQVKSNAAGFLKYFTILEALKEISKMLDPKISSTELEQRIRDLYISTTKYEDIDACNQIVDKAVKSLTKYNKKLTS